MTIIARRPDLQAELRRVYLTPEGLRELIVDEYGPDEYDVEDEDRCYLASHACPRDQDTMVDLVATADHDEGDWFMGWHFYSSDGGWTELIRFCPHCGVNLWATYLVPSDKP